MYRHTTYKTALYADDVLLFITGPQESIPALMSIIHIFESFSGCKINSGKSMAMPLVYGNDTPNRPDITFSWSASGFTYVGISITPNINDIFRLNFFACLEISEVILLDGLICQFLGRAG